MRYGLSVCGDGVVFFVGEVNEAGAEGAEDVFDERKSILAGSMFDKNLVPINQGIWCKRKTHEPTSG